jgi:hypothetical protein
MRFLEQVCYERKSPCEGKDLGEATTGFEPVMRVLQTLALPLGHVAGNRTGRHGGLPIMRAGDEIRTRDLLLGKETFYH